MYQEMYPTPNIWELIFRLFVLFAVVTGIAEGFRLKSITKAIGYGILAFIVTGVLTQVIVNIGLFLVAMIVLVFSTGEAAKHVQSYNEFLYCCTIPLWIMCAKSH